MLVYSRVAPLKVKTQQRAKLVDANHPDSFLCIACTAAVKPNNCAQSDTHTHTHTHTHTLRLRRCARCCCTQFGCVCNWAALSRANVVAASPSLSVDVAGVSPVLFAIGPKPRRAAFEAIGRQM